MSIATCQKCGTQIDTDWEWLDEDEVCDDCKMEEARRLYPLYLAEKRAGLLRPKEELDEDLRLAGRGHLVRP